MSSIDNWSQTAASNNAAVPDGAPENHAPSATNNIQREVMARVREFYDQIGQDELISGLKVSINSSDSDHDIDVTTGVCFDGAFVEMMDLGASTYVKRVDASWSVGSTAGGLDTGSVAADKRYYVWVIKRVDTNVVDVLISLSASSPTMPTSYTLKKLIGTGFTDASSNWVTGSVIPANRHPILNTEGALPANGDMLRSVTNTVTAGSTQTQAGATELLTSVNRVTVSGTDGDGVELPTAVAGSFVTIINDDSAQTIQIWPSTSDTIDGGSANAVDAVALSAGRARTYIAVDATNWYTIAESGLATPVSVANGGTGAATLTDGGVLLGSGTGAVTAMSVLADGNIVIGDGSTDPVALAAFSSSTGTLKVANGGTGASTLTDGGVLLGSGTNAVTAMGVLADSTMIVGDGSTDPVAESGSTLRTSIGVGTTDSPQFTNLTLTGFEYLSMTTGITAGTTQSQAGATALTTQTNRVTASGTDADAVKLPTAVANALVTIINDDAAQTIAVWPNTGDTIDGGSANAVDSNTLAAGNSRTYLAYDATNWVTVTNAPVTAFDPDGAVTINNSAADVDFLVKTDNNASAFTINGGGHSGTGQAAFGGAVDATASWVFDRQALTHAADTSFSTVRINRTGAVTIPSGTAAIVSSLSVSEPAITATGTVTAAASVYVAGAPTEGSNNYGIFVDAGLTRLDGGLTFGDETLTNYDEGTWTPTLVGASTAGSHSYGTQDGRYTRVGRTVHCIFNVHVSSFDTWGGAVSIGGLPFTVENLSSTGAGSIGTFRLIGLGSLTSPTLCILNKENTTTAIFKTVGDDASNAASVDAAEFDNGALIYGSTTFQVA
jgi:hypothetical protein